MTHTLVERVQGSLLPRLTHGHSDSGTPLPPTAYRMGGKHFRGNDAFVQSAHAEVGRLQASIGLNANSRLLDWGCGAGRLGIGVAEVLGRIDLYHGVDIQAPLIEWAKRHLGKRPGFEFTHVDLANQRYNPNGTVERRIPGETSDYDGFYAYSVFSHLMGDDSAAYLKEVARLLKPGGRAFVTAFVEDDVPEQEENPAGYGPLQWEGPLHCVRFNRQFFESMIADAGLTVADFTHGRETDGQSLYILSA